ncbi:hypothetical protein [Oceanobacillus jordanicus]|uniref:DUF1361 domain-containing protein n=1 Tax=Oceanobacillus jordanicus TaxID=2867266 RepID=A0AAW5B884_9BACI|nr:hypothetical protein [Oceanobacillus jordanicus]MCG3419447.1 hypothetical protein [Oceanobacillus jordanicus]
MEGLLSGLPDMLIFIILYGPLAMGIFIMVKLTKWFVIKKDINNRMLLISLVINVLNFYLIYDLMTPSPEVSSGNGNPFIPNILISFLLFISFCIVFSMKIIEILSKKKAWFSLLIIAITIAVTWFSVVSQMEFVLTIKEALYYPLDNWLTWWKSIHLNYLYFNPYTFLLGICISCLVAGILGLSKRKIV